MTREEAIRKTLDTVLWTRNVSDDNKNILTDALIESLEQEPVLDKLRAEITTLQNRCYALTKGAVCRFCKYECEYKAEKE